MSAARIELPGPRPRLVRFRAMVPSDVPAVGAVERASYAYPWSEGIFRDCLRVGYLCRVAELAREIVGYGITAMGAREAHILNLAIHPAHQGRGLGKGMIQHLLQLAEQHGADTTFLEVRPSNVNAIRLYDSLGFNQVGLRKDYYPLEQGREDALIMARRFLTKDD